MHRGPDTSGIDEPQTQQGTSPSRRDPVRWLIVCGCLLIGAILVGTIVMANGFRARALSHSEREVENMVLLLTRHFEQQFEDAESAVNDVVHRMQLSEITSPEAFRTQMSSAAVREMIQTELHGLPSMGYLTVIDANGDLINWSGDGPMPSFNVAARPYFNTLKFNPPADNIAVEPVRSFITGGWSTLVARRLTGANGVFLGLVSRRIDPEIFETFLQSIALGNGASITLFHADRTVLARYPHVEGLIGTKIKQPKLLQKILREGGLQTLPLLSPIDGVERIGSGAKISRFPIVVMVTKTMEDALGDWRSQAILLAVAALLAVAVIIVMFRLAIGQIKRQSEDAKHRLQQEKQRVDTALDNMTQGLVLYDAEGRVVMFNQRYIDLLDLSDGTIKAGCHFRDVMEHGRQRGSFDGDVDRFCADIMCNVASGKTSQAVLETADGRSYHAIDKPLVQGGWVTTIEDISERRKLEQDRDRNHAFLREIIDHIPSQITVKDVRDRRYVLVNQVAEQQYGASRDVIVGQTARDLFSPAVAEKITADDNRALELADGLFLEEHPWRSPTSAPRYVTSRRIAIHDKAGIPNYLINVVEDVTERRRAGEQIAHLAHFDALTDLPNRVLFRERIDQQLEQVRHGATFALLYIDIDEFKGINDSLGHHVGDELLKTVARLIKSCVGQDDLVARLGGDEFAVLLSGIKSRDDVVKTVSRIFEAIRVPHHCLGHQLSTDASIGIALAPQDGADRDQLTKNADLAMYAAKAGGRRTYRFFEPAMDESARARLRMEQDLRQALAEGHFELHYQPLVDLSDNTMTGCEALLRWHHPERGMISPLDFIPLAEDTGLINEIGDWVLRTACAEAATWPGHIRLAVNVSPVQLKSSTLALHIAGALAASGLAPDRLEIEITEAVLIRDDEAALTILHELRDIGVRIALDDFGTGYSSLSYLKRFPFDKIKIDRCFVSDIAAGGSSAIVQAVVSIAAASNMTTTAEGVETGHQQDVLRALGCTEMQGYLFSAPKPAAEVRKLFAQVPAMKAAG